MPKTLDSCAKVCEILLLLELLRRRRPDLNFGQVENLLSLVGRFDDGRLTSPRKSRAGQLISEGLLIGHLPHARARPRTPLDVLITGLEVAPEVLPPETTATRVREEGFARSARDLIEVHTPIGFPIQLQPKVRSRITQLIKPLKALAKDDRAQNLACGIALPFAFKAVSSGIPFMSAVGAITLLGCGIEFGVDDPAFIGPQLFEQIPEAIQRVLPGGR